MPSFYESSPLQPQAQNRTSTEPQKAPVLLIVLTAVLVPCLLAYLLVSGNENQIVAFVIAALGGVMIISRPFWGLLIFVGLLYTRPEENIPALAGAHLPLLISVVTMVSLLVQKLLNREPIVKTPLNGMIIGFGVVVVLSSFISGTTATAIQDISRAVILVLLTLNLVISPGRYHALITAILLFTGYLAAYSIYLYYVGGALVEGGILRSQASGIFSDPNDLAATIVGGLGLALARMRQAKNAGERLLYLAVAGLLTAAILFTESRGGMIALIVVFGIFLYRSSRNKPVAITLAIVVVVALLALKGGHMTEFDSSEDSANSRFWFWANGIDLLMSHPLLGVGYGGFLAENGGMTAHNSFVLCFAETGMLGYFFWMGAIYYSFRRQLISREDTISSAVASSDIHTARWDALGAQLALIAYLEASFWLSHTYILILYLLISLPVAQQISSSGQVPFAKIKIAGRQQDLWRILAISFASILFIYVLCSRMK